MPSFIDCFTARACERSLRAAATVHRDMVNQARRFGDRSTYWQFAVESSVEAATYALRNALMDTHVHDPETAEKCGLKHYLDTENLVDMESPAEAENRLRQTPKSKPSKPRLARKPP